MTSRPTHLRLALAQLRIVPGEREATLARALARIDEAAAAGADLVLLPEALPLGWMAPDSARLADAIPDGPTCAAFRAAARRAGVWVCSGIVERAEAAVYNAAVLIDDTGVVRLHHRKINELDIAAGTYARGDRLGVTESPWGRLGLLICADAFAEGEVISRTLARMGARLLLSPCAWAVPPDHDNAATPYGELWRRCYGAVARDEHVWVAGASNVGPITAGAWAGHACIGCSLVVAPSGTSVLQGPYGADADALLLVDVAID
ncbi:beta-alanine synthetase [Luteitalea sp. TBR-22]|uniref:carbon-nitrogen hydrolase family protein n=1 Tax=Luteitalea sp. TBR-22 TaxID=2802971 RepID=UPI001AF2618D|nr:carbon-nitrogen hydrolase family protein [Luteitalea sp. TBR-22]BCS33750.1 beta-alanine synthetase [Luteitalea sp. TBR-22]